MTDVTNIQISNEQAQQFARAIYTDVIEYVKIIRKKQNPDD